MTRRLRPFRVGDHVTWNSEAGRVSGIIRRVVTRLMRFKGYTVHASPEEPQYLIESDRTTHLAMHKGSTLTATRARARRHGDTRPGRLLRATMRDEALDGPDRARERAAWRKAGELAVEARERKYPTLTAQNAGAALAYQAQIQREEYARLLRAR